MSATFLKVYQILTGLRTPFSTSSDLGVLLIPMAAKWGQILSEAEAKSIGVLKGQKFKTKGYNSSLNNCGVLITFAISLDPDQAGQKCRSDLDPSCLTLLW